MPRLWAIVGNEVGSEVKGAGIGMIQIGRAAVGPQFVFLINSNRPGGIEVRY